MKIESDSEKYNQPQRGSYSFKNINIDDPRIWSLYINGNVKGLFQVETPLGKKWCQRIRPTNIDELAAAVSLIRPGGINSGLTEQYAKYKNEEESPVYIHESLRPILEKTHGVMCFQEQLLDICIKIAGFDEIAADLARRAVGKKIPEDMMKVEKLFLEGCKIKGIVTEQQAKDIFAMMQKSVAYLMNAGHSYSYAYTSVFQAFQKAFFPVEFYTASLTFSSEKMDPKEEIKELVQDAKLNNINVTIPNVLNKNVDFEITGENEISFGLSHIRSVGQSSIKAILNNNLSTFTNFIKSSKKIKRNVAEALIKSGACDSYNMSRLYMLKVIQLILGRTDKDNEYNEFKSLTPNEYKCFINHINKGIIEAFQLVIEEKACINKRIPVIQSKIQWLKENDSLEDSNRNKAIWESLYLGIPLSCSIADDYDKIERNVTSCKDVYKLSKKSKVILHAVIDKIDIRKTKKSGEEYCYLTVSDNTNILNYVVIWPDLYVDYHDKIEANMVCCIYSTKGNFAGRDQLIVDKLEILG